MRDIKFRAWNGLAYATLLERTLVVDKNGRLEVLSAGFVVEQYTGLKDKNGLTDVYEGDIISPGGEVIGNVHERKYEQTTGLVIEGMGTSAWRDTEQEAVRRGCRYAK